MEQFKVAVRCITYNHSRYIEEAMNGFCMQQTDFPFVCVIVDDASTDGEQDVIRGYLQTNFNIADSSGMQTEETEDYIAIFARHKTNVNCFWAVFFLNNNHYQIRKSKEPYFDKYGKTVEYVAFCEGDDYWIDSKKLQKQVAFLDNHNDFSLCYTQAKTYDQSTNKYIGLVGEKCDGFLDLLLKNKIATLSVVMRADIISKYEDEIHSVDHHWPMGDYPLWLFAAANGELHFMPEVTAVYRMHAGSASRPVDFEKKRIILQGHLDVQMFFSKKYNVSDIIVNTILYQNHYSLSLSLINAGHYWEAFSTMKGLHFCDYCKCCYHFANKVIKNK